MSRVLSKLPQNSTIHLWLKRLSITEIPKQYQVAAGLAVIGALAKRQVWVDGIEWQVYPNLSVLFIGPSGIGKDQIINKAVRAVEVLDPDMIIPGQTMEYVKEGMLKLGDPAATLIPAAELTSFLGGKDYQKSMIQELTDLLSTNPTADFSNKGRGKKVIYRPTVTMLGGSTPKWLAKAMPEGGLEGGFLPRFLIVCCEHTGRVVSWPGQRTPPAELLETRQAGAQWAEWLRRYFNSIHARAPMPMIPSEDAMERFEAWDWVRHQKFGPHAVDYAHRARGLMHKMAMTCALSCDRKYLEAEDYEFAAAMMDEVADGVEKVVIPIVKGVWKR